LLENSEAHREDLQGHINGASLQIKEEASQNKSYSDTLISEINSLKRKIQSLEERAAQT